MSAIAILRQVSVADTANSTAFIDVSFHSVYDCDYLHIDKAAAFGHNSPHVLGTPTSFLRCPEPHFCTGFLL